MMTEHDPFAMPELGEDLPAISPWASLAQQCRWLAELADQLADREVADLAPIRDEDNPSDPLGLLDVRSLGIRSAVAACRRDTWRRLVADGKTPSDIARLWGVSRQNVSQILRSA